MKAIAVEPRHVALWAKAAAHTVPAVTDGPLSYGNEFRPLRKRKVKLEKLEAVDEDPPAELLAND
jgi:hypothetical protein